jgi:VanZ family protein
MRQPWLNRNFSIATGIIIAVIVYGCLHPFAFRRPVDDIDPVRQLIESGAEWHGRADFLTNMLLYMPLGFFAVLAVRREIGWKRLPLAMLAGGMLSVAVELIQYYDEGRTTAAIDCYSNVLGTGLGAAAGCMVGGKFRWPLLRAISANPVPALLLAAWIGWRLFPHAPAADVYKYRVPLRPIFLHPHLEPQDLFRETIIWLTVCTLGEAVFGGRRLSLLFPLLAAGMLMAEGLVSKTALSASEICGAVLAFTLWFLARRVHLRVTAAALLLGTMLIDQRLEPFQFGTQHGHFGWLPFLSFMAGSESDALSFLQKFFLYGSLIWLLIKAGLRLWSSATIVTAALLITGWAEIYLPNRSADITDPIMAVAIAGILALMNSKPTENPAPLNGSPR